LVVLQVGVLLERLVGRLVPAAVYISAGVATGLLDLSSHPIDVTVSSTGAVCGLYGLLAAIVITQQACDLLHRRTPAPAEDAEPAQPAAEADVQIPLIALKRIAIGGAVFLLYTAIVSGSGLWGVAVGLAYGAMLAPLRIDRRPTPKRVGIAAGIAACAAAVYA